MCVYSVYIWTKPKRLLTWPAKNADILMLNSAGCNTYVRVHTFLRVSPRSACLPKNEVKVRLWQKEKKNVMKLPFRIGKAECKKVQLKGGKETDMKSFLADLNIS